MNGVAPSQRGPRTKAPTPPPNNIIPFAKPRAISSLPVTFSQSPSPAAPAAAPAWGSNAPTGGQPWGGNPAPGAPAHMSSAPAGWNARTMPAAPVMSSAPLASAPTWGSSAPVAKSAAMPPTQSWGSNAAAPAAQSWGANAAAAPAAQSWGANAAAAPQTWGSTALAVKPAPAAPSPVAAPEAPTTIAPPLPPAATAPANDAFENEAATVYTPPSAQHGALAPASRWAVFEKLGLKAPQLDHKKLSGHVVTAYRALGFIILSIIVVVLIGYLTTTAFFYMSSSWIVPMAISPTDEKVVSLQSQLAERQTTRDRTAAELDQAQRAIAVQQEFQAEFAKAIKSDLDGRKAALARMHELAEVAANTRAQIKRSNNAYASASKRRMDAEWRAGLIDRDSMLNGKFQIAQISNSNLSLAERQAEYETRADDLDAQAKSLEALLSNTATEGALSYDVLKIKQEFEASRLETQRAIDNAKMLRTALEREDKLLASLKQASYLKALADGAQVAFVPYGNLGKVKKGEPLYGCALTMVFCRKVGTVLEVLPGEVLGKHPNRDKMLRGQMVELKMSNASAATDDVLFVGGRPMLL